MSAPAFSRAELVLVIEKVALAARYAGVAILLSVLLMDYLAGQMAAALGIAGLAFAHNLYVHALLFLKRHELFATPLNFCIHFGGVSIIVLLSGAEASEAYALYILFVVGYSAYAQEFYRIVGVAALSCAAYMLVVFVEWQIYGLASPPGVIAAKFVFVMAAGLLVGSISDRLRHAEEDQLARAQELASSEATLRTILDSAADPILVFDENELIIEANGRACAFLQVPRSELLGTRIRSYIFDDGSLPSKIAALRARGEYQGEQLLVDREGEEHTTMMVVHSFVRDQRRYYVLVARDITADREREEATRLANHRLEQANLELAQAGKLKAEFLAAMSRKLRSPLSVILGFSDLLLEGELGELNDEQRRALQACRRAAARVARVVDESLDLGRLEAARIHDLARRARDEGGEA